MLFSGVNPSKKIKKNLGVDTPVHFTAFYPMYKMINVPATTLEKLEEARKNRIENMD
jgi:pyruvate formate lyase activating enzyme